MLPVRDFFRVSLGYDICLPGRNIHESGSRRKRFQDQRLVFLMEFFNADIIPPGGTGMTVFRAEEKLDSPGIRGGFEFQFIDSPFGNVQRYIFPAPVFKSGLLFFCTAAFEHSEFDFPCFYIVPAADFHPIPGVRFNFNQSGGPGKCDIRLLSLRTGKMTAQESVSRIVPADLQSRKLGRDVFEIFVEQPLLSKQSEPEENGQKYFLHHRRPFSTQNWIVTP